MKIKESLANIVAASFLFLSACAMPQKMDDYKEHPEKYNPGYSAAILVAKPTAFYDYLAIPFMGIYEMRVANALKTELGVDSYYFVRNAEWKDLESALIDDKIKVIVVAGHGDNEGCHSIGASELSLSTLFVYHPEIKKDWFVRHTCGSPPEEHEYVPRVALEKIIKEANETYKDYGVSVGSCLGFLIPSNRKFLEEYYAAREDGISEEEVEYFLKKSKYVNTVVMPKLNEELNEKIKASLLKARDTFGYVTVEDPSHVLGWDRLTTPLDFLLNPLPGLEKAKKE